MTFLSTFTIYCFCLASQAHATDVALNPTRDTFIKGKSGETAKNHGSCTLLTIDREGGDLQRALFYFDLSSISASATITAATLELTSSNSADMSVGVYRMTSDWDEGSQCGTSGQASWSDRKASTPWGSAGGDFNGTAVATKASITAGLNTWDVQSLVQDWVDGTYSNFGVMVGSPDGGGDRTAGLYSRENATPSSRPILRITYTVSVLTLSSAANQFFTVDGLTKGISPITVTDDGTTPAITAANDIRIRIPSSFNMTWDTSDTVASISGTASGKVSTTVSYEDSGKTLVINVTSNFTAGESIVVSGLSFKNFSANSAADNLELEVLNNGAVQATDDKTIAISDIRISSAANQDLIVGSAATAISAITITDQTLTPRITAANDIRIHIPDRLYMTWDTSDTTATFTGTASGKVSNPVSYEDNGKTLVINVTSNFAASDSITVSGLSYANFTAASYGDNLELEVNNDGSTIAEDPKYIAVGGWPASGSMLVYGEGTVITPRYRTWSGSAFSLEGSAANADDTISWVVLKASPVANEMILGVYSSATKELFIQTWNGSAWTSDWSTVMNLNQVYRGFDIAYERNSGDAVVVFSDQATHTLKYRKRVGGVWDASDQTIAILDDEANWVRAESRPTNDDIFVAAESNAKSVYAMRWNGTTNTWEDQILASSSVKNQDTEAIAIAFERASGDAFLIWGDNAKNVLYRRFTTSWQSEGTAYSGLSKEVLYLKAAYDPRSTSSNIAIGIILADTKFAFGAWDGSIWVVQPATIAAKNNDQRGIDVQFSSSTGQAIYIFNQSANAQQLAWRTWSSAGGFGTVTVEAGVTSADINFMQLQANPCGNDMMAAYVDNNKDLFHRYWNGSSWTALDTALEADISDQDRNEAFMFAWKLKQPTAVDLIAFTATGASSGVSVVWQTGQESNNKGFNLYRAEAAGGSYAKLNGGLIPAASISGGGGEATSFWIRRP